MRFDQVFFNHLRKNNTVRYGTTNNGTVSTDDSFYLNDYQILINLYRFVR